MLLSLSWCLNNLCSISFTYTYFKASRQELRSRKFQQSSEELTTEELSFLDEQIQTANAQLQAYSWSLAQRKAAMEKNARNKRLEKVEDVNESKKKVSERMKEVELRENDINQSLAELEELERNFLEK